MLVGAAVLLLALVGCERAAPEDEHQHEHQHQHEPARMAAPGPVPADDSENALAGPGVFGPRSDVVEVVNATCPLLVGQSVGAGKRCERSMTRRLGNRLVGFCDAECVRAWDQMSESRREALLRETLALESGMPSGHAKPEK